MPARQRASEDERVRRNLRRQNAVPAKAIARMLDRWEPPTECHALDMRLHGLLRADGSVKRLKPAVDWELQAVKQLEEIRGDRVRASPRDA